MSTRLCATVTGWNAAGTEGWAEPESRQRVGVLGQQLQALSLHRAGRMLLTLSWEGWPKTLQAPSTGAGLGYSGELSLAGRHCGMVERYSPDNRSWEYYASTITACTPEAGARKTTNIVGKKVRWILPSFFLTTRKKQLHPCADPPIPDYAAGEPGLPLRDSIMHLQHHRSAGAGGLQCRLLMLYRIITTSGILPLA